jgi:hypothetical protein
MQSLACGNKEEWLLTKYLQLNDKTGVTNCSLQASFLRGKNCCTAFHFREGEFGGKKE